MHDLDTKETFAYQGTELALFEQAKRWKAYWASQIRPFIGKSVIEVGAGLGSNVPFLYTNQENWLCLEPDPALSRQLFDRKETGALPDICEIRQGTLDTLPEDRRADTILYIDVLEHIEHDEAEFARASERLIPGGHLIVLCPAHDWLFSSFDTAIGHHRRYNEKMYNNLSTPELQLTMTRYLDSAGLLASSANRWLLRSAHPTATQIGFWNRILVPISRFLDPLTGFRIGKTVLGVWTRS